MEMQRHKSIFHREPRKERTANKHTWRFTVTVGQTSTKQECGLQFASTYKLAQHRKLAGHSKRSAQSNQIDSVPVKRMKQGIPQADQGSNADCMDEADPDEEVKRCAVCDLKDQDEVEVDRGWIECDYCGDWYHLHCVPGGHETPDLEDDNITAIQWSCDKCA